MQDRYEPQRRMDMLEALFQIRRLVQYAVHADHFLLRVDDSLYEVPSALGDCSVVALAHMPELDGRGADTCGRRRFHRVHEGHMADAVCPQRHILAVPGSALPAAWL